MMKNPFPHKKTRTIIIGIVMLSIIVLSLAGYSNGQSSRTQVGALETTMTPAGLINATQTPVVQHEPDVTFGIVLAGILLVVVILFGTLHATRGFQKPPRVP
jgi:hypothetical protein